jgi:hypothetical protein
VKRTVLLSCVLVIGCAGLSRPQALDRAQPQAQSPAKAESGDSRQGNPDPQAIIRAFSAKETEFYEAWKEYTYHQVADVRVLSVNGAPRQEKMTIISDIVFLDDGRRDVQIVRRPPRASKPEGSILKGRSGSTTRTCRSYAQSGSRSLRRRTRSFPSLRRSDR